MNLLPLVFWSIGAASDCIAIRGDQVLASDLASRFPELATLLPSQTVMLTPSTGVTRWVATPEGRRLWQKLGLREGPSSDFCVTRKSMLLNESQLLDALAKGFSGEAVQIEIVEFSRFAVPEGALEFGPAGLLASPRTSCTETVLWRGRVVQVAGGSVPVWARVRLRVKRPMLVAKQDVAPGQRLSSEDTEIVTNEVFPLDQVPTNSVSFVGQIAKQRIRAGQRLLPNMFEPAYDIMAGQVVRVEVVHGQVHLRFTATAEEKGRRGDWVWLKPANGRRFKARVSGPEETILEVGQDDSGESSTRRSFVNRNVQ